MALKRPTVPTLYIVRHESTKLNTGDKKDQRLRGWQDLPLGEEGIKGLPKLANLFTGYQVKHVITADLTRHIEMGMAIAAKHGATLTPTFSFRPWDNTGAWGNREIDKSLIKEMQTHIDNPDKPLPGGEGETFREHYNRAADGLQKIMDFVVKNPAEPTAIVMSTRGVGATIHYLYGDRRYIVGKDVLKPGGVMQLQYVNGNWKPAILRGDTGFFHPSEETTKVNSNGVL